MAKTIGQLVTGSPAAAYSDTDLIELEQGTVSKGGTLLQMKNYILPAGIMTEYAGANIPAGWLLCDGSAINRTTYASLFAAISTTWGIGDNSTTFNLPDMRESCPVGVGTWASVTGTTHGAITAHDARALGVFADDQVQGHQHTFYKPDVAGSFSPLTAGAWFGQGATLAITTDGTSGTPRTGTVTRGKTIGVTYIIKY
jgi:microcystin-dependent protein